jgi:hypothetical protein
MVSGNINSAIDILAAQRIAKMSLNESARRYALNEQLRNTAIRILREQEIARTTKNNMIRKNFGDRITIALTAECEHRDREIKAILETIKMLEDLTPEPA